MKPFFFSVWLLLFSTMVFAAPAIAYTISPLVKGNHQTFLVQLKLKGTASGKTEFSIPYEAGRLRPQDYFTIKEITNSRQHFIAAADSGRYVVLHPPGAELTVHYTITNALQDSIPSHAEFHKQMLAPAYFHVLGTALWVVPHDTSGAVYHISLQWLGFPTDFIYLNSHGAAQKNQNIKTTLQNFQHAVYMGGDLRLHRLQVKQKPVYFGIRGQWSFKDEDVLELIRKTIEGQRAYWNDYTVDHYTIGLIPMRYRNENERSITGSGYWNTFVTAGTNSKNFGIADMAYLYNHELMHHWIGQVLPQAHPENRYKWFHEGFTDYFAYAAMLQSGQMPDADFKKNINSIFAQYYNDSTNQWPNEKLEKEFWSPQINKLPYQRGLIFAFYLNESISHVTGGKIGLKNIMQQLFAEARKQGNAFSEARFLQLLQQATGYDYTPEFKRFITDGSFIAITDWEAVTSKVALLPAEIFDLGFTTDKGIALNAKITNIRDGSNVQKVGLQVGDVLVGFSANQLQPGTPATIVVKRGAEEIKMQFLPIRQIKLPQLK